MNSILVQLVLALACVGMHFGSDFDPSAPGIVEAISMRLEPDSDSKRSKGTRKYDKQKRARSRQYGREEKLMAVRHDFAREHAKEMKYWDDWEYGTRRFNRYAPDSLDDYYKMIFDIDIEMWVEEQLAKVYAKPYGCLLDDAGELVRFILSDIEYGECNTPSFMVDKEWYNECLLAFELIQNAEALAWAKSIPV